VALRLCEGTCGSSYEDHGQKSPTDADGTVSKFLCLGCALSFQVWAVEHGLEDPYIVPSGNLEVPDGR
jgi:hypothetical protein